MRQNKVVKQLQENIKENSDKHEKDINALSVQIQANHNQQMDLLLQISQKIDREQKSKITRDRNFQGPSWPIATVEQFDDLNNNLKNQIFRDQVVIFFITLYKKNITYYVFFPVLAAPRLPWIGGRRSAEVCTATVRKNDNL